MSAAGPELPPHLLAKRKRQIDETGDDDSSRLPGAKRSKSPETEDKKVRIVGPAPPPASLDERPPNSPNGDKNGDDTSSDEDDDFGPALPGTGQDNEISGHEISHGTSTSKAEEQAQAKSKTQRDEWMTMPPKQDDLAARMDPTKLRARGFNTGKGARGPSSAELDTTWTETLEQKAKRLQDEVMGIKPGQSAGKPVDVRAEKKRAEDEAIAARLKQQKNASLYETHQGRHDLEKDDDPSKRAFDREKDIGGGVIGKTQRKEMMNNAQGFSSKFSGGGYL